MLDMCKSLDSSTHFLAFGKGSLSTWLSGAEMPSNHIVLEGCLDMHQLMGTSVRALVATALLT